MLVTALIWTTGTSLEKNIAALLILLIMIQSNQLAYLHTFDRRLNRRYTDFVFVHFFHPNTPHLYETSLATSLLYGR